MENKCVICGEKLAIDQAVLVLTLPSGRYATCCLSHEGSKELKEYVSQFVEPSLKNGFTVQVPK
jgi:hypothetical protein